MKQVRRIKSYGLFFLILLSSLIFLGIGFFSFLDSEWQDLYILEQIKNDGKVLDSYKNAYSQYPDSLEEAKIKNQSCILLTLRCFEVNYKPADDKQSYTIASKVNSSFVVYFRNNMDYGVAFEENYQGNRSDLPIYRKDKNKFSNPEEWPGL